MIQLMEHQRRAVEIAREHPRYAFMWEPGSGKTIAILAAVADARGGGFVGKTLVLAPKSILRSAWCADAEHFPSLKAVCCWHAKPAERRKLIATPGADVLVCNYETFKKHAKDFLAAGVRRLVIDESSKVKNPDSQITRECIRFSDLMDSVYLLSGTPAPNCQTEYFGQMRCLERSIFGSNFWRFAYHYFSPTKRMIDGRERIIGWKMIEAKKDQFYQRLQQRSWSLAKRECLDLPPQVDILRDVELSRDEFKAYRSMLEELRIEFGDGMKLDATMQARLMKLRQITSGFIYTGESARIIGTSKLDELVEVLGEIGDRQVVIWAQFAAELRAIMDRLADGVAEAAVIDGQTPMDRRFASITRFQDCKLQYLVCHPAAAGHGITLTAASYAVYFSHSFSFEEYQQSRDRIHRKGQTEKCTYYHLLADSTVDQNIWHALRGKRSMHETVMQVLGRTARVA